MDNYPVIFGIETDSNGNRSVHFYAYGYLNGETPTAHLVEYTFFILPLAQVIAEGFSKCETEYGCEYTQYITDYDNEDELKDAYNHYDNGNAPKPINEAAVCATTPDGIYVLSA